MNPSLPQILFEKIEALNKTKDSSLATYSQKLDEHEGWKKSNEKHCLSRLDLLALMAALGSGRPLLITGEPGCGKSHTARAYASLLGFKFYSSMIKPGRSHESLLWNIDHVKRFAEANIQKGPGEMDEKNLALNKFRTKEAVWRAYEHSQDAGTVLLLDEADKAELTLVNGLLDVLDQGSFIGPEGETISKGSSPLLVVITSNGDRQMPPAVIRRCAQHEIKLPDQLDSYLASIGAAKFPEYHDDAVLLTIAAHITKHRDPDAKVRPGVSEYVDLLRAWHEIKTVQNRAKADQILEDLSGFFLKKSR